MAVPGAAAHAAVFFWNKKELQTDVRAEHLPDLFFREGLLFVELQYFFLGQKPLPELLNSLHDHLSGFLVQTDQTGGFRSAI
jgi:hypothetical protein